MLPDFREIKKNLGPRRGLLGGARLRRAEQCGRLYAALALRARRQADCRMRKKHITQ